MNYIKILFFPLLTFIYWGELFGNITPGKKWIDSDLDSVMEASSQNDPFAQGFLSLVYAHGDKSVKIDYDKAYKLAMLSSESNHWLGHFALGFLYRSEPIGPDLLKVRELYLKAFQDSDGTLIKLAARKDPVASYVLGEIFTSDKLRPDVLPDLKLAYRHYEISSSLGYAPSSVQVALFKIYNLLESDSKILDVKKEGMQILNLAVQKNLPSAHHYLGRAYFEGDGFKKDNKMALVHFQAAADKGYGEAQLILADFYSKGLTGTPKLDLAQRYANLALKTNYAKAKKKLDELEASQRTPVDPIPNVPVTNAQESQELAANEALLPEPTLPSPSARINQDNFNSALLPSPYEARKEMGKPKQNPPIPLDKRNVKNESISSPSDYKVIEMAKNYYWGRSVERNYSKAYQLFLKSAKAGNAESSRYLGLIYLSGNGVPKDLKESIKWFERASSLGDDMATKHLNKLKILSND